MDIEAYSYTVMSAIAGMIIVFSFLGFLCVMMVVIKKIFDKPAKDAEKVQATPVATPSAVAPASADNDSWVVAAVVAFLEQEDIPVSAMSWLPPAGEKQDPWVSIPKLQNHAAKALG